MRLLLTRPAEEGERTRHLFDTAGHRVLLEPLTVIERLPVTLDLSGVQALAITSRQGLGALAAATAQRAVPLYAVGAATAEAARAAGFTEVRSAEGDAAALARLLTQLDPDAGRILHATGDTGGGELQGALTPKGYTVVRTVLYRAKAIDAISGTTQTALKDGKLDAVVFFSPRNAEIFVKLAVRANLQRTCGRLVAACLSRAIATAANPLPWRSEVVADKPNLPSLLAAIATYERRTAVEAGKRT